MEDYHSYVCVYILIKMIYYGNDDHMKSINVAGPDGAFVKTGSRELRGGWSDLYGGGGFYTFLGGNIMVVKDVRVAAGGIEVMVDIAVVVGGMVEVAMGIVVVVEEQVGVTSVARIVNSEINLKCTFILRILWVFFPKKKLKRLMQITY